MNVRAYAVEDEEGWVRCRVLSFLDTSYFDDVHPEKETYRNPSIELVADREGTIIGLIDLELDTDERAVCSGAEPGGMIWHLAVHPDFQRQGIGTALFEEAARQASEAGVGFLEAWTREDDAAVSWYERTGFEQGDSYLHVYLARDDAQAVCKSTIEGLSIDTAFAQYVGDEEARIEERFDRVHRCQQFVRRV